MTDDPRPHDHDLLRAALHAEAGDVHAGDELLGRILAATAPPPRWRSRAPFLAVAAAFVVVVAGLAVALLTRDPGESVVAEDPEQPATTEATSPSTTEPRPSTTSTLPPPEGPPTLVALVREDGWLVTVDLETGEQRELYRYDDPTQPRPEGGHYVIDAVDLSPDGQWIYFSTCCEPAEGVTLRIPVGGGEPEEVGFGAYPRVSPDGRYVATAGSTGVYVYATDVVGIDRQIARADLDCCAGRLAWSPDGTQLAYVIGTGAEGETPQVRLLDWDGASLTPADLGEPDNPGWFVSWDPDGTIWISTGEPIVDDLGLSQDRSYRYLLWIDERGVVHAQAGHGTQEREPVPGLPEAIAADW